MTLLGFSTGDMLGQRSVKSRSLLVLLAMLTLSACASQRPSTMVTAGSVTRSVENLQAWDIVGKIGMKSPAQNGSASLQWKERPSGYNIDIVAPLGLATIRLAGNQAGVKLVNGDQTISASNLQELEQKVTDVPIPFGNLQYWIRGIPATSSNASDAAKNSAGYYQSFNQAGWDLRFENQANIDGYVLPRKITAIQGVNKLTIVIRQWTL